MDIEQYIQELDQNEDKKRIIHDHILKAKKEQEFFISIFPKTEIRNIGVLDYVPGKTIDGNVDRETFAYLIEFGSKNFGRVGGGSAQKFGVYMSKEKQELVYPKQFSSSNEAYDYTINLIADCIDHAKNFIKTKDWKKFSDKITELIESVNGTPTISIISKIIAMYYPDEFIRIWSHQWLNKALDTFQIKRNDLPEGGIEGKFYEKMQRLMEIKISHPIMKKWSNEYFSYAIGEYFSPKEKSDKTEESITLKSNQYKKILEFNKNLILYGPPGTGKTFKAEEIASYLTTNQNNKKRHTWKTITSLILLENNGIPLNYHEISKRALEKNLVTTVGSTPHETLAKIMREDIAENGEISFFIKPEDGIYGLNLPFTFKKAAEFVIFANNAPMKINDIAKQIIKHNLVNSDGETPERTLSTEILRDKDNGDESVFIQLDNGLITLRRISRNFQQSGDENNDFIRKVTFHPSYSYEDFVEGFRPNVDNEGTQPYVLNDGIFKEICNDAKNDLENNYVLLIDEINRGNIPKIFGELITVIENGYRGPEYVRALAYSKNKDNFYVPKNLYIIGTMNTADKSLVQMDEALRRRFVFEELMPEPNLLETENRPGKKYKDILENINNKIIEGVRIKQFRDRQIGHSYFWKDPFGDKEMRLVIKYQIIPLLQDYFYDDYEEIRRILGSKIIGSDNRPGTILDEGNESELIKELRSHLNNTQKTTDDAENPDEE